MSGGCLTYSNAGMRTLSTAATEDKRQNTAMSAISIFPHIPKRTRYVLTAYSAT
jgi:hypothetical protein